MATSKHGISSNHARGTSSYIPPELLNDNPVFTNKVDIWGLGCILHELATYKLAFFRDLQVQMYATDATNSPLAVDIASATDLLQHHVAETIRELLQRDYTNRPRASAASRICSSYALVLGLPIAQTLVESSKYPTYSEWKTIVESTSRDSDFLDELAQAYSVNGQPIANALLEEAKRAKSDEKMM
jgi:serine/threonine protein kinase